MKQLPQMIFFLLIIACAGFSGVWIGQNTLMPKYHGNNHYESSGDLHSLLHKDLQMSVEQEQEISEIEKEFERRRTLYNGQMKTANLELAQAIKESGYKSPDIELIVHKIHKAMGQLQALSLEHLDNMQNLLSEEQNKKLKEMVIEQLYRNAGE